MHLGVRLARRKGRRTGASWSLLRRPSFFSLDHHFYDTAQVWV